MDKQRFQCPTCYSHSEQERFFHDRDGCYNIPSGTGSQSSSGTAGARGRSTSDSDQPVRVQIDVSTTPDDGSNTYQGRLAGISLPWSGVLVDGFTLMVFFDYRTRQRLQESLSGRRGWIDMAGAECSLMIPTGEPPTT